MAVWEVRGAVVSAADVVFGLSIVVVGGSFLVGFGREEGGDGLIWGWGGGGGVLTVF